MASDEIPAGFWRRWSRRKVDVREGRLLAEPQPGFSDAPDDMAPIVTQVVASKPVDSQEIAPVQTPSLADVQPLTPESDFTGFMARGVAPEVKNAAMKKLFTDPHFNVMDRMDVYIDDYSQPDPLPMAVLRQMSSAKTLNLVEHGSEIEPPQVVAQSAPAENNSNIEPITHDHADLRLQPDPTPRSESAEPKPV